MNRFLSILLAVGVVCVWALPARAVLKVGDTAPDFSAQASVGGKDFTFSLSESLKRGPVVLYFFPKAFTSGCTVEAHEFAEAADTFTALGATLIGMSADKIDVVHEFSTKECRDKFPVAADPDLKVIHAYDAVLSKLPALGTVADRTSYVIAPDGKVLYEYTNLSPDKHVENTLAAVRQWKSQH